MKKIAAISDEQIAEIAAMRSFEKEAFRKKMGAKNRWSQLLNAHLMLEHVSIEFLDQEFANKDVVKLDRWGLHQKVEVLHALGVLSEPLLRMILKVNSLRNKAAHDFKFKLENKHIDELHKMYPKDFFTSVGHPPSLHNILFLLVGLFEIERSNAEAKSLDRLRVSVKARIWLAEGETDAYKRLISSAMPKSP